MRRSLDAGLFWRLARNPTYVLALALVAAGFVFSVVALRTLPVFLVQAGRASSLAVAALGGVLLLGARLTWRDMIALASTGVGLVVLAASVAPEADLVVVSSARWWLLGAVVVVGGAAALAARVQDAARAGLVLAALAGVSFAVLAVGARIVADLSPFALVVDPVGWAMAGAGALGLGLGGLALQRAPVVVATSLMVGVETCLGAVAGMVLAGDRPGPGHGPGTVTAFVLVLAGVLAMARFGTPDGVAGVDAHG